MYLKEEPEYIKETAMLIEETLRQRYVGMKIQLGHMLHQLSQNYFMY